MPDVVVNATVRVGDASCADTDVETRATIRVASLPILIMGATVTRHGMPREAGSMQRSGAVWIWYGVNPYAQARSTLPT